MSTLGPVAHPWRVPTGCAQCVYWWRPASTTTIGECRRHPPHYVEDGVDIWPQTADDAWCGEWRDR